MTTIDDVLPQLSKARMFSAVDAKHGFWHCKLDDESSRLITVETPFVRYRWLRLCFGLSVSPEIFSVRLNATFSGLRGLALVADDSYLRMRRHR